MTGLSAETKRAIDAAARRAADSAVKKTLLTLGVDASTGPSIQEVQQDMAFLRRTRVLSTMRSTKIALAGVGAGMTLLGSIATMAVQKLLGQ